MKARAIISVAVLLLGCSDVTGSPDARPENRDLSQEWPLAAPADQGFDEARLAIAFNVADLRHQGRRGKGLLELIRVIPAVSK